MPSGQRLALGAGGIVAIVGTLVLVGGWMLDAPALRHVRPDLPAMSARTAFGFVLLGVALVLAARDAERRSVRLLASAALCLALATLAEHLTGRELLARPPLIRDLLVVAPGAMSLQVAIGVALAGVSLLLVARPRISQPCAIAVILMSWVGILGYLYGVPALRGPTQQVGFALHAGVTLMALGVGLLALRAHEGVVAVVAAPDAVSRAARWALPLAFALPGLLGWLQLRGARNGLYPPEVGVAVAALVVTAVLLAIGWWLAWFATRYVREHERRVALAVAEAERGRSEVALRYQLDLTQTITENTPSMLLMMDSAGRGTFVNSAVTRVTGYDEDDLLGQVLHEVLHHSHPDGSPYPSADCPLDRALPLAMPVTGHEDVFVRKDGTFFPVRCSARPIFRGGAPIGTVLEVQDVTEERAASEALRRSEERLRRAAEAAGFGTYSTDLITAERHWSAELKAMVGLAPDAVLPAFGRAPWLHPDDAERVLAKFEASRDPAGSHTFDDEHRVVRADGVVRWLHVRGATEFAGEGAQRRAVRSVGTVVDVTERKRAEAERDALLAEAERTNRAKDEFLAMLSHELRNPLAAVRNAIEAMRIGPADEPRQHRAQDIIQRQTAHMVRLLDDLLDVSRITQGKIRLDRRRVTAGAVVAAAVEGVRPMIESRGQALALELPPAPAWLDGDEARLVQAVGNLLGNAAKYTPFGGAITVAAEHVAGERVAIRVRDSGVGLSPEARTRIFDLFVQEDVTLDRRQGGLGIGLTLARRLVELHGGTVEAFSDGIGQGSEFVITLPVAAVAERAAGDGADTAPARAASAAGWVLVVDDEPDAADGVRMLLELIGREVRLAYDGPSALRLVGEAAPQLALVDIGMPGMTGYDLGRALRERLGDGVTLVALSGYCREDDKRLAREAGFDRHVTKPIEIGVLTELLPQGSWANAPRTGASV